MVCIYCGHTTRVYNSRVKQHNPSVWRRRRCEVCVAQFSTLELPDYTTSLVVTGPSHQLVPFQRDKLFLSLHSALAYRQDVLECASQLTDTVIGRLLRRKQAADGLLQTQDIAKAAHQILKRFDPPSAQAYRAFHRSSLE